MSLYEKDELDKWIWKYQLKKAGSCKRVMLKRIHNRKISEETHPKDARSLGKKRKNSSTLNEKELYDQDSVGSSKSMDNLKNSVVWEMGRSWVDEFYWMIGRQNILSYKNDEKYLKNPDCIPNDMDYLNCYYSSDKIITRYAMTKFSMYTKSRMFDVCKIKPGDKVPEGISVVFGPACIKTILEPALKSKKRFIYIDHAYFNRGYSKTGTPMSLRVIPNGIHPTKILNNVDSKRFFSMGIPVKKWRTKGSHIVVCPPTGAMLKALGVKETWLKDTVKELRKYTDRLIVIRPKPGTTRDKPDYIYCVQNYKKVIISENISLEDGLKNAWAIVAPASGASIEAVCMGIPSFSEECSPAAPVSSLKIKNIESPYMPDRLPFLNSLAYSQFNMLEIESGFAWNILKSELFSRDEILNYNKKEIYKKFLDSKKEKK